MKASVVGFAAIFVTACTANGGGAFTLVAGDYTGPVVNGPSSCPGNWRKGAMNNATLTIRQMDANVTFQINGSAGVMLETIFGTNSFAGTVTGNHIDATLIGTVQTTSGGCIFTSNGELAGDLAGNILSGDIIYTPQTNGHPDCASMQVSSCISKQTFGFSRH